MVQMAGGAMLSSGTWQMARVGITRAGIALAAFCIAAGFVPRQVEAQTYQYKLLHTFAGGTDGTTAFFTAAPPWRVVPPLLPIYRQRGHRRLAARTYQDKCTTCMWGCRMAVEMIIDQWNPSAQRYRTETFCYGPRSCPVYQSGPARKVPGRHGMSYPEEEWVDDEATSHRGLDE